MQLGLVEIAVGLLALAGGGLIGLAFGYIQDAAARKNQARYNAGELNNCWAVMPGSARRTAFLLVALVGVQVICPLLFHNGSQWWVSGGIVAGYGWTLWRKLRQSIAAGRSR